MVDWGAVEAATGGGGRPGGLAIAALVCGIVGAVFGFIPFVFVLGWVLAVVAIVLGSMARRSPRRVMAGWGLGLGGVALLTGAVGLVLSLALLELGPFAPAQTSPSESDAPDTSPSPEPSGDAPSTDDEGVADCGELVASTKEGRCSAEGLQLRVVNRDSKLRLEDATVGLRSTRKTRVLSDPVLDMKETAEGVFVLVRLKVTNRTGEPQSFNENDQVALFVGDNQYSTVDYEIQGVIEPLLIQETIQPDSSKSGYVVFDVPRKAVREIEEDGGGLAVFSFGDAEEGFDSAESAGLIRLSE